MKTPKQLIHDMTSQNDMLPGEFICPYCNKKMSYKDGDYCPHCKKRIGYSLKI